MPQIFTVFAQAGECAQHSFYSYHALEIPNQRLPFERLYSNSGFKKAKIVNICIT